MMEEGKIAFEFRKLQKSIKAENKKKSRADSCNPKNVIGTPQYVRDRRGSIQMAKEILKKM